MVRLTLHKHFLAKLMVIVIAEFAALDLYVFFTFPSSIAFATATTAFEKIVDVDAALLGFTGVIVAVSIGNWKKRYKYSLAVLASVVTFLLLSLLVCVRELILGTSVSWIDFFLPLGFLVGAITILFVGLATT